MDQATGNTKSQPAKESAKVTTIEDANIVAFLVLKGFICIPFIQTEKSEKGGDKGGSARVAWDVEGEVAPVIHKFYENENVGVHDYVRVLKDVRSQMYNCKSMANQLKQMQ